MAEHRALQVLRAIQSVLVAANTRAGANVEIGRTSNIDDGDAIDLNVGPDSAVSPYGTDVIGFIDSVQTVYVDLHTRSIEHQEDVMRQMYQLRAQSHVALLADPKLGLPGVVGSIRYQGADVLDREIAGDRIGSMRTTWDVAYRMEYDNPAT